MMQFLNDKMYEISQTPQSTVSYAMYFKCNQLKKARFCEYGNYFIQEDEEYNIKKRQNNEKQRRYILTLDDSMIPEHMKK